MLVQIFGIYSYFFVSRFKFVDAFELISEITYRLKRSKKINVTVHVVALSNLNSNLKFFIPFRDDRLVPSLSSLESRNDPFEERNVDVLSLDNYKYEDADLIKINVEGHEFSVLEGAVETIKKHILYCL